MRTTSTVLCGALLAAAAWAQESVGEPQPLLALLQDPSRKPVAGAHGVAVGEPPHQLLALAALSPAGAARWTATAISDARGILRFPLDGQPVRAASGFVATAAGLGALLPRLHPGRAERVVLQPMAALAAADGEPFTLFATAVLPDGSTVELPPREGRELRLPAGDYELWARSSRGWAWLRLELRVGQRREISFAPPPLVLQLTNGARAFPVGRADADLFATGGETALFGEARRAPLATIAGPHVSIDVPANAASGADTLRWPPEPAPARPALRLVLSPDDAAATLYGVVHDASGRFRVVAASAGVDGAFTVPEPPDGDTWLLCVADGFAPRALPWATIEHGARVELARGVPLDATVATELGDPAVDVRLEFQPLDGEAATVIARTDAHGRATFGRALAPGILRISDERFANAAVELPAIPAGGIRLVAAPGERLAGRATFGDGEPAGGAVVTLRDPRGRLRPASRATVVANDGTFVFDGLPADVDLVLFATSLRDGHTWSAKLPRARAGDDVELRLADEDPQLLPPADR